MENQQVTTPLDSTPIMDRLKVSTRTLHDEAEQGAFNRDLVRGRLPLAVYVESLAQLWEIHRTLEGHLRSVAGTSPRVRAVLRDYHYQQPYLLEDLAYFGRNPEAVQPLDATRSLKDRVDEAAGRAPICLLGFQYVFEGSNNGSKFLAKAVRRAYGLDDSNGTRYLDPYGERQPAYWQAFKADMNAQDFTPVECDALVEGARAAFQGVIELHRALYGSAARETEADEVLSPA
jgi:heme oxygenase